MKLNNIDKESLKRHLDKWNHARELVAKHNEKLISEWKAIPWWKFWERPSFEEQRQIIMDNWRKFNDLPTPRLSDYFQIKL